MTNMQRIRLGLLCAKLKLERIHTQDKSYPKDPNPENWRTISGAKVHLTNGKIDGGAAGKFEGNDWVGKKMHASDPRAQNQSLFGGNRYGWGVAIPNEEEHFKREARIQRRAKERNERYEAKKAAGLAKQAEVRAQKLETAKGQLYSGLASGKYYIGGLTNSPTDRIEQGLEAMKPYLEKNKKYSNLPEYKQLEELYKRGEAELEARKNRPKESEWPQEKTYSALEAVAELRKRRRTAKAAETPKSSTEKTAAPKKKGNMKSRLWDNAKEAGIDLDAFHVGGGRWDKRGTIFLDLDKMPPEKRAAFTQMAKEKGYKVAWNGGLGYSLKEEKAPSAARAPKPTEKTAVPEGYEEYLARKNAGQKNPYEEGQEARRERLENRAEKAASEGQQRFSNARKMMEVIPMGQPILVGHYSERSHRSHLNKIDQNMRKGFEAQEKAQYYQSKAENVGTAGISSMDPDAKFKIYEKLRDLEALQDKMKQENYENGKTYASYEILNNASEIRRLKKRLEELSKVSASEGAIHEENPLYKLTQEEGRYQFKFDGKPDPEVRDVLKRNGFKWSPTRGTWVRSAAGNGSYAMKQVQKELEPHIPIPFSISNQASSEKKSELSPLQAFKENARQFNIALQEARKRNAEIVEFKRLDGKVERRYWNGARFEDKPSLMYQNSNDKYKTSGIYKAEFKMPQ